MTKRECEANVKLVLNKLKNVGEDIKEIKVMLRGAEGRNGLVADVNELKSKGQMASGAVGIIVGVAASILTSYIVHVILG